jgi:hypothetical protein
VFAESLPARPAVPAVRVSGGVLWTGVRVNPVRTAGTAKQQWLHGSGTLTPSPLDVLSLLHLRVFLLLASVEIRALAFVLRLHCGL